MCKTPKAPEPAPPPPPPPPVIQQVAPEASVDRKDRSQRKARGTKKYRAGTKGYRSNIGIGGASKGTKSGIGISQ